MTSAEFNRWLRQAGMTISTTGSPGIAIELVSGHMRDFMELLSVVRKAERERCAKAVDGEALAGPTDSDGDIAYGNAIRHAAKAVRALKDEVGG